MPSLRRVAQRVEFWSTEAFIDRLILRMHGGASRLLTADMAPIPLQLSLAGSNGRLLDEFSVLTVQLQGMATGDGAVVPAGSFEITASSTTEVQVILGDSGETTLRFSVSGLPSGITVELLPEALRVTRLEGLPTLDVDENGRVGIEDLILIMEFLNGGRDEPLRQGTALQARLERLLPVGVVDLRLDVDGNRRMDAADFRILMRYLAGLRGRALGEGARHEQVEVLLR